MQPYILYVILSVTAFLVALQMQDCDFDYNSFVGQKLNTCRLF